MWIDRLEARLSNAIDNLQHPGYWLAGIAAIGVAFFLMFSFVVAGQVDRGQERGAREAALRSELWRCGSEANAALADRCRQIARGELPASGLARWDDLPQPGGAVVMPANGGIVPVSLNR
ncbi:MAG: hypothetical protein EOP39_21775 [Rubrivivax sp.]|nr:MAG: hypothetical protein EOP39_21775 [Rubrivivax sp.]